MPPSLSRSFVSFELGGCSAFGGCSPFVGPDLLGIFAYMHYTILHINWHQIYTPATGTMVFHHGFFRGHPPTCISPCNKNVSGGWIYFRVGSVSKVFHIMHTRINHRFKHTWNWLQEKPCAINHSGTHRFIKLRVKKWHWVNLSTSP